MGGNKHKGQAQRSKNNVRPANSGRVAELVDKGQHFSSFSGPDSYAAWNPPLSSTPVDVFSPNVDPQFSVILKKMNKKDATTRFKALLELKELCKDSVPEVMVEVLPVWCKVYVSLALDVENRVREAVQEMHKLIVSSVGRNLAPHLKTIVPLWFLSQYDTYAPAASVASAAFQIAFPPHKISEVITFCQAEILQFIHGNLLSLTPQILSKGNISKDEMDLKYERIIICSLNGLGLYLSKVPIKHTKNHIDLLNEIFSSQKFWKFSKFKSPGVRAAWFTLLSSACQFAPCLPNKEKKHVANSVISAIDDYDSSVLSVAWEAALCSFTAIEDFWQHINIDKFFLPKFVNILRVGGQGNASYLYPNFVLVLNSIPDAVIRDKQLFFGKILISFQEGMKQPLVYQSPSESESVMASFVECIQFIIMKNIDDETFCSFILDHLCQVMSLSQSESSFRHQIRPLIRNFYQMLLFWERSEHANKYRYLQKILWEKILDISTTKFNNSLKEEHFQLCLDSQFIILSVLKSPYFYKQKFKVTFAGLLDTENSNPTEKRDVTNENSVKNKADEKIAEKVLTFAGSLLQCYYSVAVNEEYEQYHNILISQIQRIIDLYKADLYPTIKSLKPDWFNSLLLWIRSEVVSIVNILAMIFETLAVLDISQKHQIIHQLTEGSCKEIVVEGLKFAARTDNAFLNEWLHSDEIYSKMCEYYDSIEFIDSTSSGILKSILLLNVKGDFVIGSRTAQSILKRVTDQLLSNDETKIRIAGGVVMILIKNISEAKCNFHEKSICELLMPLFVNIVCGRGLIVHEPWEKAVALVSQSTFGLQLLEEHFKDICAHLGSSIPSMETVFDISLIHQSLMTLLNTLIGNDENKMRALGMPFIRHVLSSIFSSNLEKSMKYIENAYLVAEVINGNLSLKINADGIYDTITEIIDNWDSLKNVNTFGVVNSLLFSLKIISAVLGIGSNCDLISEVNELEKCGYFTIKKLPEAEAVQELCEYILKLIYGYVLLKKMGIYYSCSKEYFEVSFIIEPLEEGIKELVLHCKPNIQEEIINMINLKLNESTYSWMVVKSMIIDLLGRPAEEDMSPKDNDSYVPQTVLSVPHLYKLRDIINNNGLPQNLLPQMFEIICDNYKMKYAVLEENLKEADRDYFIISSEIARLFEAALANSPLFLTQRSWDFARINVVSWLKGIAFTKSVHKNYIEFVTLTNAVCKLLETLSKIYSDESLPPTLLKYCEEWKQVFAVDAFLFLLKCWETIIEERSDMNHVRLIHTETVGKTLSTLCSMENLYTWDSKLNTQKCVEIVNVGLLMPYVPVQLTSYKLLLFLFPAMMELDETLDESSIDSISFYLLEDKLSQAQMVVLAMLQDYSLGVCCSISPFTDSYVYTLGYFLLWSYLIWFCHHCQTQQKYLYPLWIKEKNIVAPFIEAVTKLMPESVLCNQESSNKKAHELFTASPSLSFSGWSCEKLSHFSCWLLTELMGHLPAVIRQWASEAEPKQLSFLDRITSTFISPYLCSKEMEAIKGQQKPFDNMKVFTYPSAGEVIAVYSVEESSTELSIQLPNNFPLSPPKVDISKAMISSLQTRQWLKQLTIFLTHQNGSIWDGLILWKKNLDKKFEGVEECYICFSILHTTTHQLPKSSCHICKKKFHSFCLYKWFSTSNKSTCPICRAIF